MDLSFSSTTVPTTANPTVNEAKLLEFFVASITDYAIYMLSVDGIVTSWNAGAERFKGYQPEEIIGRHFSQFYTAADRSANLPAIALQTAREHGKFEDEGLRVRKDGSTFWASVVIDSIRDKAGNLIGYTKVTRDITERRDAAKALQQAQEALFQAQKMEAIGKLTGGIAHDFNNLLSVIVNGLALLRITLEKDNDIRILDSMERATSRGTALTQQLLSFSRQQPLKQDAHNINLIINSFEAVLRRANKASIEFHLELAANLPQIMIDAQQFEAALINLIMNAGEATPAAGAITLSTSRVQLRQNEVGQLPAGDYVKISVADTGEGMPLDVIAKAVEPFFTTKPIGKGTGLGLSQVYGLVQQCQGDMSIKSTLGSGTEISLFFPVIGNRDEQHIHHTAHDKALVVDDQPDVLDMAITLFRTLGYEVLSANNGEDAIKILKRIPNIEVLFSDMVMPGMSGIELGLQARTLTPNIKVILTSGYPAPALKVQHNELDQFQFVTKPYRVSDIVKKLRANN
ncbi:MAG TPA: PAS domain S-box protein [Cellvibrio sp.]|nr:PAS domain S-box protein [Cellvibrio sp.]